MTRTEWNTLLRAKKRMERGAFLLQLKRAYPRLAQSLAPRSKGRLSPQEEFDIITGAQYEAEQRAKILAAWQVSSKRDLVDDAHKIVDKYRKEIQQILGESVPTIGSS